MEAAAGPTDPPGMALMEQKSQVYQYRMRWQLGEQLRCLELQGELRRELLQELAEFMRRRAEVELEYSRGLDKLVERFSGRGGRLGGGSREHQSFRKEPSLLSPLHCWAVLLQQTRQQSRESTALSEVLGGPLAQRLSYIAEDVGRLVKKSKDLEQQLQEELLEVVSELQMAKKTYQVYHTESLSAEAKLREAERQEEKRAGRSATAATTSTESGPLRKGSIKKGGRLVEKRHAKFLEHKLKCTKARNEYLLSLASVNAAVSNYYLRDVMDLMDCCDTGFHLALGQVLRSYTAAESRIQASQMQGLGSLEEAVDALDPIGDKAKVLEVHAVAFCPPLRFDYQPHEGDETSNLLNATYFSDPRAVASRQMGLWSFCTCINLCPLQWTSREFLTRASFYASLSFISDKMQPLPSLLAAAAAAADNASVQDLSFPVVLSIPALDSLHPRLCVFLCFGLLPCLHGDLPPYFPDLDCQKKTAC
ncbi:hypothetical protein FD755_015973, partial [Muntiacus reevesi]